MAVKNSDQTEPKTDVVLIKPARIDGVKVMPGKTVSVDATVLEQLVSNGAVAKSADDADTKPAENAQ